MFPYGSAKMCYKQNTDFLNQACFFVSVSAWELQCFILLSSTVFSLWSARWNSKAKAVSLPFSANEWTAHCITPWLYSHIWTHKKKKKKKAFCAPTYFTASSVSVTEITQQAFLDTLKEKRAACLRLYIQMNLQTFGLLLQYLVATFWPGYLICRAIVPPACCSSTLWSRALDRVCSSPARTGSHLLLFLFSLDSDWPLASAAFPQQGDQRGHLSNAAKGS